MGIPDSSILDLIGKIRSWISWGTSDSNSISCGFEMTDIDCTSCCHCNNSMLDPSIKCKCESCGRLLCGDCVQGLAPMNLVSTGSVKETMETAFKIKLCQFCSELGPHGQNVRRCSGKIYPSESPRQSPEPPSPSFSGEEFDGDSPYALTRSSDVSFSNHPSPLSVNLSPSRTDEDEGEEFTSSFFSKSIEYFHDTPTVNSGSVSTRHEIYNFTSVGSKNPSGSPSRIHITSNRVGHYVQEGKGRALMDGPFDQEQAILERPAKGNQHTEKVDDTSALLSTSEKVTQPLDFDNNGLIWFPPPADIDGDVGETSFFTYDDEDDEVEDSGATMFSTANLDYSFLAKEKQNVDKKEPFRALVLGHFRSLVSQLLLGQGIITSEENSAENWLNIITTVVWNAANFIKPDTNRGGSMDPCDYVKVKCVASGSPSESKFVKGIVCTKNIKHKRMTSEYKRTRVLLLGGALEYQRVPNQLASFNTLLQQENDHLKMIVSKIEAHRPNVLLVEKSVSSFAIEHLLAKEISLVLNVKRPLLERIARCTGASITPSTDHISGTRLGHCDMFRLEKISEEHAPLNQLNKKPSKTLMFFEGCPRRLGCTVVLRGSSREELKKVKNVVKYAVFAAYHLSLQTSFFADEGSSLPNMDGKPFHIDQEKTNLDNSISTIPDSVVTISDGEEFDVQNNDFESADLNVEHGLQESLSELEDTGYDISLPEELQYKTDQCALSEACEDNLALDVKLDEAGPTCSRNVNHTPREILGQVEGAYNTETSSECYSSNDSNQSIVVSFSSHCMLNGTVCERARLLRIKFYGPSDKPLGRYLRDNMFDQSSLCRSCKESAESHVICYTHQHGNLTINVRHLPSIKLPGERDGKIWMWHRCLKCAYTEGVPPTTQRVVMSDAAWGLSFGKFLELSFSNHATGNRVASCGHSLQRDCLRFFGFGSTVAFFRYSPINIFSVRLPPPVLEFCAGEQSWARKEASELLSTAELLYANISDVLQEMENKISPSIHKLYDTDNHVSELKNLLANEMEYYKDFLQLADKDIQEHDIEAPDILEINRLRHSLVIGSQVWDRRLCQLKSFFEKCSKVKAPNDEAPLIKSNDSDAHLKDVCLTIGREDTVPFEKFPVKAVPPNSEESDVSRCDLKENFSFTTFSDNKEDVMHQDEHDAVNMTSLERHPSAGSILSDKIDSAWSGADIINTESTSSRPINRKNSPSFKKLMLPTRVYSFDSAQMLQERMSKGLLPPSHFSTIRSFHASGDYRYMIRDPISYIRSSHEVGKPNPVLATSGSFICSASLLPEGARLMVAQNSLIDVVFTVYDDEPMSIISYALSTKQYENWFIDIPNGVEGGSDGSPNSKFSSRSSNLSAWQSFGSLDLEYMHHGNRFPEDASYMVGSLSSDPKSSPHLRISFEDEHFNAAGKVKFSVTCYFAKQFDALRRKCCASEVDFIRSLSRCRRWSAQGGKSNVYFAKSFDERFIIKQVTKTELESFNVFSPEYFKYLTDALNSGSPTCLAKVLGIYQVSVKHLKGGRETKMDLMVMENLFFRRNVSKIYDLKGSLRSRYNSDPTGANKVMLDLNLLETLRTNPLFLGSKAKRILERAVWNDTSFLASIDVMDYSLLMGIDEDRNELVVGIIDFMRQYTWDKHLETWVKTSGILGGLTSASPTIISPKQYKKRFRKAMTSYFLTVPDQWSS
ncbi:putative 1-phosphatidylinositol-3-phosphate 5-kinase FAB1C [Henckelia pumila]|uniref:putative 1-phosphatidylinositol-3-phosphate 5-kinase FAB1C n=1 Tax=Henckelia pumila TaxID=405737 RepID=UPI003C6E7805